MARSQNCTCHDSPNVWLVQNCDLIGSLKSKLGVNETSRFRLWARKPFVEWVWDPSVKCVSALPVVSTEKTNPKYSKVQLKYSCGQQNCHWIPMVGQMTVISFRKKINSSPASDVCMHQWTRPALVQIMACRLLVQIMACHLLVQIMVCRLLVQIMACHLLVQIMACRLLVQIMACCLLVQIMACRLFSAKPLSKPMLRYCQLDSKEQISVKF